MGMRLPRRTTSVPPMRHIKFVFDLFRKTFAPSNPFPMNAPEFQFSGSRCQTRSLFERNEGQSTLRLTSDARADSAQRIIKAERAQPIVNANFIIKKPLLFWRADFNHHSSVWVNVGGE